MLYSDEPDFQLSDSLSVLRRDIPWDIYQTARLITDRDLQLLRRFDKKEPAYQGKLLEEVGAGLARVRTREMGPRERRPTALLEGGPSGQADMAGGQAEQAPANCRLQIALLSGPP